MIDCPIDGLATLIKPPSFFYFDSHFPITSILLQEVERE